MSKSNKSRKYTSCKNKNPDKNIQECAGRKQVETEMKIVGIQDEAITKRGEEEEEVEVREDEESDVRKRRSKGRR